MILLRYIAGTVVAYTLFVLVLLVALSSFFGLVDDLGNVGKGEYTFAHAVWYTLLRVPGRLYELLPQAALLGSLLGLGSMAGANEVVAMRASGVSVRRLLGATLYGGLFLMGLGLALGELVVPDSEKRAQQLHTSAIRADISARTGSGYWARAGSSYINLQDVLAGGVLRGVTVYELDRALRLRSATHAASGRYVAGQWLLEDVDQSILSEDRVRVLHFDRAAWRSILTPELLNIVEIKPENLSLVGLYRYIHYLQDNGLDSRRYWLALWQKAFRPLFLLVMLVLAVPFVLGPLRSVTVGQRVLTGALLGIAFSIAVRMFGHAGLVYGFNPLASTLVPGLLFLAGAVFMLRRVH